MTPIPTARETYDAIVIGGGIGGLVAANYLARAHARVLVVEASPRLGGLADTARLGEGFRAPLAAHVLYGLDPQMVRDFGLGRFGFGQRTLKYAERDMKLIALRPGGRHITLPRWTWRARAAIAGFAPRDAENYPRFRRDALRLARRLKPLWDGTIDYALSAGETPLSVLARRLQLSDREARLIEAISPMSAASYLDRWFENDALKAALGFDAALSGLSPQEAGSVLPLIWRTGQGDFWRRGASAQLRGGPGSLAAALEDGARRAGAEFMTSARVGAVLVEGGRAQGVMLANGEVFRGRAVLSSLDIRRTLLDLVPPAAIGFGVAARVPEPSKIGAAKIMLALSGPPPFAGLDAKDLRGRLIIADRPESGAEIKGAALTGGLAANLIMEVTVPTVADPSLAPPGGHILSVLVPLLPVSPKGGWEAMRASLLKRVLAGLESFAPGLKDRILAADILSPDDIVGRYGASLGSAPHAGQMLAPYGSRVRTALPGLYLCGGSAEPVDAISGRAGRIAAALALADRAKAGGAP